MAHQRCRHAIDCRQQDAVHNAGGRHVIVGTMGGVRPAERTHQIQQTMGFQTRQRDFRQVQRIEPEVLLQRLTRWVLGAERAVEVGVMSHHIGIAHKFNQALYRIIGARGVGHIFVADIRKVGNVVGDGLARVHERDVPAGYFTFLHTRSGNLYKLVVCEGKTCGLRVDDDHIFIQHAEIVRFSVVAQRMVALADPGRGVFYNIRVKPAGGFFVLSFHAVKTIIYCIRKPLYPRYS